MKKIISAMLTSMLLLLMTACGNSQAASERATSASESSEPVSAASEEEEAPMKNQRIKLSFDGHEVFVSLYDIPASQELLSRLPLTLEFQDYAGEEKISYLDEALPTDIESGTSFAGDFTYYAPWGNLAIFYNKSASTGGGLIVLGNLDSGRELLAAMNGDFTMIIEAVTE